jgi:hypothetical protein
LYFGCTVTKKVVGVFVRFRAASITKIEHEDIRNNPYRFITLNLTFGQRNGALFNHQ